MKEERKFHQPFGVYGILVEKDRLLVIHKKRGPYANRFDLPGGSLEQGESLTMAMRREFLEETGIEIEIQKQIGMADFMFPCNWREFTHIHHIAAFYTARKIGGEITVPEQFEGQDSLGAEWVSIENITIHNASPLVLKAVEWIQTGSLGWEVTWFPEWEVKKTFHI
ncbi:NUDIX hydrolase [Niallia sp. Sow4_A1]|uniref:NUDIX hydrolase n=1 Tax=Bacillaceae TaxID=186817 RepID=UPI0004E1A173|nr:MULTISPECIES: NUDIX hydrolase [unclassified Bacillus (in: firmicutes)]CAI9386600.1 RNA pyrophosphohydrolase [Bacillus sp. T2.9-1]